MKIEILNFQSIFFWYHRYNNKCRGLFSNILLNVLLQDIENDHRLKATHPDGPHNPEGPIFPEAPTIPEGPTAPAAPTVPGAGFGGKRAAAAATCLSAS